MNEFVFVLTDIKKSIEFAMTKEIDQSEIPEGIIQALAFLHQEITKLEVA